MLTGHRLPLFWGASEITQSVLRVRLKGEAATYGGVAPGTVAPPPIRGAASTEGSLRLPSPPVTATVAHRFYDRGVAGQNLFPRACADALVLTINY